jgi:hypothetical protein
MQTLPDRIRDLYRTDPDQDAYEALANEVAALEARVTAAEESLRDTVSAATKYRASSVARSGSSSPYQDGFDDGVSTAAVAALRILRPADPRLVL